MSILTIVLILGAVILGVLALRMLAGLAKIAVKAALLILVIYLVFTFVTDKGLGPTGLSFGNASAPKAEGQAYPQAEADSQHLPDCTPQGGQDTCGLP